MSAADDVQTMARHVLFVFSAGPMEQRMEPGSFTRQLISLIQAADPPNRARLSLVFPGYVRLVHAIQNYPEALDQIVAIAETGHWDLAIPHNPPEQRRPS